MANPNMKKGMPSLNPVGRPKGAGKGTVSLKATLIRLLTPDKADKIVETLIEMATVDKDIKAIELIAKLKDEFMVSPAVAIQINNISDPTLLDKAKKYAQLNYDNEDTGSIKAVIDVDIATGTNVPDTASNQP